MQFFEKQVHDDDVTMRTHSLIHSISICGRLMD